MNASLGRDIRSEIKTVCEDALSKNSSPERAEVALEQIKANGRDVSASRSLTMDDLIMLIDTFIQRKASHKAVIETFTIIANALVLNPELLGQFDPHLISSRVLNEAFQPYLEPKEEYLLVRLLFLCTFHGVEFEEKTIKTGLTIVAAKISLCVQNKCQFEQPGGIDRLIFIECMKLSFNLLHHYSKHSGHYIQGHTARDLATIYYTLDPLDPLNVDLFQYISNVLLCIPVSMWLYDAEDAPTVLNRILSFVEVMVNPQNSDTTRQDRILAPPLSLLHCIVADLFEPIEEGKDTLCPMSPSSQEQHTDKRQSEDRQRRRESHADTSKSSSDHHLIHLPHFRPPTPEEPSRKLDPEKKKALVSILRSRILPSSRDREKVLGQSKSLCSYLLQITIDPVLRTSRNIIFDTFWKASNESPDQFVDNFGLGFASSFLASHGIAFPGSVSTDSPTTEQLRQRLNEVKQPPINPITGQYLHFQNDVQPGEEMTEEEKLRDAERLFVLFERLKANNMIKVENPVGVAARNGELEKY